MSGLFAQSNFEKEASKAYERFASLAKRYHFTFRRYAITRGIAPFMVFIGNHSSGKSTLINWILNESVQDTGLAPTDDGFTVIMYGEVGEFRGQAALDMLPKEFKEFARFGDGFLHGLCVKLRPVEILKSVSLIDTPGMIDSAAETITRDYDFDGVIRALAELCDMVFYLFDPDKPGTTGETVRIFSNCLQGVKFKLHIMLNKCDAFSSMHDFVRTYGTLCWNLSKVLNTKDMPKIWTIYSGVAQNSNAGSMDLTDFNRHRDEFRAVLEDGTGRRRDNLVSQINSDLLGLSIRMRILNLAWRKCLAYRVASIVYILALSALPSIIIYLLKGYSIAYACGGLALGVLVLGVSSWMRHIFLYFLRIRFAKRIDDVFRREYGSTIVIGTHDDLVKVWDSIRDETAQIVRLGSFYLPLFGEFRRRGLEQVRNRLNNLNLATSSS